MILAPVSGGLKVGWYRFGSVNNCSSNPILAFITVNTVGITVYFGDCVKYHRHTAFTYMLAQKNHVFQNQLNFPGMQFVAE